MLNKKRYVGKTLSLVSLIMMLALVCTGCKTDDLEVKMDEHISQAESDMEASEKKASEDLENAVKNFSDALAKAADKAAEDVNAAKAELTAARTELEAQLAAIKTAQTASAEDIANAEKLLDTLSAKLSAAETLCKKLESDMATDAELNAAIEALKAQMTTDDKALNDAIEALEEQMATGKALDEAIEALKAQMTSEDKALSDAIDALKEQMTAADNTLNSALKKLEEEIGESINAVKEAYVELKAWNDTTDTLVDGLLADLDSSYSAYAENKLTYSENSFANIQKAYNSAYIRLMRATTVESANAILESFKNTAADVPYIVDEIYGKLMEAGENVDDITLDDEKILDEIEELFNEVYAIGDSQIKAELLKEITAYGEGEDKINLKTIFDEYKAAYDALFRLTDGSNIKKEMDEALTKLITVDSELDEIWNKYTKWIGNQNNKVDSIEGFADTVKAFEDAMNRQKTLETAKTEADALNDEITALLENIVKNGASIENQKALDSLKTKIENWVAEYFVAPYDKELPSETAEGSANYNMVNHGTYANAVKQYEEAVKEFVKAAEDFENALNQIPEKVTLNSKNAIDAAWSAYNNWVDKASLGSFDYSMGGGKQPSDYYDILVSKTNEYDKLEKQAKAIHKAIEDLAEKTYKDFDEAVSPETPDGACNKYKTEIDAIYAMIETLKADNGGDLEGNISDEEFAKLAKCNAIASLYAENSKAKNAVKVLTNMSDTDKAKVNELLDQLIEDAGEAVAAITKASDAEAIVELTNSKLEGIAKATATYDVKVKLANGDADKLNKLKLSYIDNTMLKIADAATTDDVDRYVGLVESELNTALN